MRRTAFMQNWFRPATVHVGVFYTELPVRTVWSLYVSVFPVPHVLTTHLITHIKGFNNALIGIEE